MEQLKHDDVDYEENLATNNITGGTIDYQGTDDFPSCTMSDKIFIISNPNKHSIGGIQIKENIAIRRMKYTVKYIANMSDVDALNKKLDQIEENTQTTKA